MCSVCLFFYGETALAIYSDQSLSWLIPIATKQAKRCGPLSLFCGSVFTWLSMSFARSALCRSALQLSHSLVRPHISNNFLGLPISSGFHGALPTSVMSRSISISVVQNQSLTSNNLFSALLMGRMQPAAYESTMRKRRAKMNKVWLHLENEYFHTWCQLQQFHIWFDLIFPLLLTSSNLSNNVSYNSTNLRSVASWSVPNLLPRRTKNERALIHGTW